ncbi:SusC/RagA family TonB-linked outer membrane protein [Pedobacter sp. BMA]|uniref:SusC/RagA family TonB-linked outer membrane protein n=1 Tax=Pedobacter sp. BMA TaxID=1663685 RepID=UPI00064942C3|nr:SusC/RagA family TonB-linked outer membrane protein [Pedobacter sp. BMA]KLT67022.1 hypothetical protein AB669_03650 [Pedobacter sp. BMA]
MRLILLMMMLSLFGLKGMAQGLLTGKVVSANGKPLVGVLIRVKASQQALQTDEAGMFGLQLKVKAVDLMVSLMGYQPQVVKVVLPLKEGLLIKLQEASLQLEDVQVSTGYQQLPKERATGSFSQINGKLFNEQQSTDILSRLEAVGNSISVDRRTSGRTGGIAIRGISTIQGIGGPLIVVDNFPYEGDLDNLNPNEVESISFLKDAAASSIWGAKAGNGVIVITTRKGKLNTPLQVNLNVAYTLGDKSDLFYQNLMSTADYIDFERSVFSKGYYDSQINSTAHPALSPVVELLLKQRNGQVTTADVEAQLNAWKGIDVRNELLNRVYEPLLNQQYSLSLQSGSKAYAWLFSGGFDRNSDNLTERFDRYNLRYQNNWTLVKGLQLNSDLYYTYSNSRSGKTAYNSYSVLNTSGLYPYAQLADADGNALPIAKTYSLSYLNTAGNGRLLDWKYYPLTDYLHSTNTLLNQDVTANFGMRYEILKGLTAELKYRIERQWINGVALQDANSFEARDIVNRFTQLPSRNDAVYKVPKGGIRTENNSQLNSEDVRGQLNYNRTWKNHSVATIAGAERRNIVGSSQTYRKYGFQDETWRVGIVDYSTAYPTIVTGGTQFIPNVDGISGTTNRFVSMYANAAYTFKERYLFSLSARSDASNLYGVNTNEKWNPLWSTGLGWIASGEPFYHLDFLPYLKLRSTYGVSGNTDQGKSAYTQISYSDINTYTNTQTAVISKFANPELKWEKVKQFNVGLDFKVKGERLSGSIDYFEKRAVDLFGTDLLDYTGGAGSSIVKNVASMKGKGVDVELNSLNLNGAFRWTTQLNMSFYKDEVTDYYLTAYSGSTFVGTSSTVAVTGLVGKPVYSIFSYRWAGLDPATGDPRGYVKGVVSKDYALLTGSGTALEDLVYHGSALPTLYGSIGNIFSYKGLSLTLRLLYKFGYYFRKNTISDLALYSGKVVSGDYANRWQKAGDEVNTDVPSTAYPYSSTRDAFYAGSVINLEKGDHIRLQYIALGYDLEKKKLNWLPMKDVHCFLNVSNVGILWKATNLQIDPDQAMTAIKQGRTYSIGLRTNF